MTHWKHAVRGATFTALAILATACLPGGSDTPPTPTPERREDVQAVRTVTVLTPTPAATELPVLPSLGTYTVRSGDNPTLIAEIAGVPPAEQDAWIMEMLSLNGLDAYSLQVGRSLVLPPLADGTVPTVDLADLPAEDPAPPAAVVEPAQPLPEVTDTPEPQGSPPVAGVPFAPTPPFVAFTSPTATDTPTATATPPATPTPSPPPTPIPPGERAWLTSSEESARYYYCDLDEGWKDIPPEKLLAFDSEQQLLAVWGRFRERAPDTVC